MPMQSHERRSEHWVVIAGTARVRVGEETRLVATNDAVVIPEGETHEIENTSETDPLELVKVTLTATVAEEEG